VISTEKAALLWMHCREIAPFETPSFRKKIGQLIAHATSRQLKASLDEASAGVEKAKAQLHLAQQNYDRQAELFEKGLSRRQHSKPRHAIEAAKQTFAEFVAVEDRARLAYGSSIDGVNTTVARVSAELRDAQYDLEQTTVLAPTAGFVTQVSLRPGMYVSPAPLRPVKLMALRVCERRERKKRIGRNRPSTTLAD
jgi:multidrug resistance efflux pump